MRLSTRAHYAVRAMADLCCYSNGKPVSLREIADREKIPLNYLEQLFFRLKKGNVVESVRGAAGGYLLARSSSSIRIGEIVALVEEPLTPVACMEDKGGCARESRCMTHDIWSRLGDRIREFLDSITLDDLVREASSHDSPEKHGLPGS